MTGGGRGLALRLAKIREGQIGRPKNPKKGEKYDGRLWRRKPHFLHLMRSRSPQKLNKNAQKVIIFQK